MKKNCGIISKVLNADDNEINLKSDATMLKIGTVSRILIFYNQLRKFFN